MKNPEEPEWMWGASVSEVDGRWLMLYASRDTSRVGVALAAFRAFLPIRDIEKQVMDS
jgi:hypothetical protein